MHTVTPTKLRKHLFGELDAALHGVPVRVETKHGSAVIISEASYQRLSGAEEQAIASEQPKIRGRVVGNLDHADEELEAYLELVK
jgi:PHD/YefM family antitoxin component YafN of YafNO toxin-antitoxin module